MCVCVCTCTCVWSVIREKICWNFCWYIKSDSNDNIQSWITFFRQASKCITSLSIPHRRHVKTWANILKFSSRYGSEWSISIEAFFSCVLFIHTCCIYLTRILWFSVFFGGLFFLKVRKWMERNWSSTHAIHTRRFEWLCGWVCEWTGDGSLSNEWNVFVFLFISLCVGIWGWESWPSWSCFPFRIGRKVVRPSSSGNIIIVIFYLSPYSGKSELYLVH